MKKKLLQQLLDIHMMIDDMKTFIPITACIEDLDEDDDAYKKLVGQNDQLLKVLGAFSKASMK